MDLTLNLEVTYLGVDYRIIENLSSDMLLVVPKETFDRGEFPVSTLVIPNSADAKLKL